MIDPAEIARLDEARLAQALADVAPEHLRIGGGVAGRGEAGHWANTAAGLGLNGDVSRVDLGALVAWHSAVGAEPRAEVTPFVSAATLAAFDAAGFRLRCFETVLFRGMAPGVPAATPHGPPEGVEVGRVDKADAALLREAMRVAIGGFYPPGVTPGESDLVLAVKGAMLARCTVVAAREVVGGRPGRVIGAGSLEVFGRLGTLFGLSVLPEHRRRGVQQALIAERLNLGAAMGLGVAVISSRPGDATERNVRRMGFGTAYTKAIVVRPGEGLRPVVA